MTISELKSKIFIKDPEDIISEVILILRSINKEFDTELINTVFNDTLNLFSGRFPGFQAAKTKYHDQHHTISVFLCTARLIHASILKGKKLCDKSISLGLINALFHDSGFIQTDNDLEGTGAKYLSGHEERSIDFTENYLRNRALFPDDIKNCAHIIGCTIISLSPSLITFRNKEIGLIGKIVGTADIISQMSDRSYLEKLHHLYSEFQEGKIPGFKSEIDLLEKTVSFYENISKKRLIVDLENLNSIINLHFESRFGTKNNYYQDSIDKNIEYLKDILYKCGNDYKRMLRRIGVSSDT